MNRDPLAVLRDQATAHAIGSHARGDYDEERRWLDVLILLDQHDTAPAHRHDRETTAEEAEK